MSGKISSKITMTMASAAKAVMSTTLIAEKPRL